MLALDLVSNLIPLVSDQDTVGKVLNWMDLYRVAHLPVTDGTSYLGLVSESDILGLPDTEMPLGQLGLTLLNVYVTDNQHIFEVIERISSHNLTLMPVLSTAKEYLGCISLPDLVRNINLITSAGHPGAIIQLNMPDRDYSLTTIARIIEENNAKILNLNVMAIPESREISLTIKINTIEVGSIIRSLERFGYSVKTYFLDDNQLDEFYRTRYEEFMKFMDI
jgi:predicted transcriptional regulator